MPSSSLEPRDAWAQPQSSAQLSTAQHGSARLPMGEGSARTRNPRRASGSLPPNALHLAPWRRARYRVTSSSRRTCVESKRLPYLRATIRKSSTGPSRGQLGRIAKRSPVLLSCCPAVLSCCVPLMAKGRFLGESSTTEALCLWRNIGFLRRWVYCLNSNNVLHAVLCRAPSGSCNAASRCKPSRYYYYPIPSNARKPKRKRRVSTHQLSFTVTPYMSFF